MCIRILLHKIKTRETMGSQSRSCNLTFYFSPVHSELADDYVNVDKKSHLFNQISIV